MTKIAVVALGGNALTRAGQSGSYDEMMANAAAMATAVNDVLDAGWRVVVVHGNGPQVGNLAMQQEAALQQEATAAVPAQPLALLGAMTQGMLGSVIARAIDLLRGRGAAAALVTHVTVDPADPAFGAPSKPIGPFFEPAEAERLARRGGWVVKPDSGRGYRRVVASPQPLAVIEIEAMRALVEAGRLVIAGGGGGIPVLDRVMLDYGTPSQSSLSRISADQAARYLAEGQFPPGSMGPKIEAALRFLDDGGELSVITSPALLAATLAGHGETAGTRIERAASQSGQAR